MGNTDKPIYLDKPLAGPYLLRPDSGLGVQDRGDAAESDRCTPAAKPRAQGPAMTLVKIGLAVGVVCAAAVGLNRVTAWVNLEWLQYKQELVEQELGEFMDGHGFELDTKTRLVASDMTPTQLKKALYVVEQARQQCEITVGMVRDTVAK